MTIATLRAAQLAQAVYTPPYTFDVEGVRANLVHEGPDTAAVIQGTENPLEVLRDIDAFPVTYPGLGGIHAGALKAALVLYPLFVNEHVSAVIGHSLGGMVAEALCGLLLKYGPSHPLQLFAFEPAMIAVDDTLRDEFTGLYYPPVITRVGNDPVPTWPELPSIGKPVFRHSWDVWHFGDNHFIPLDAHKIANVIAALTKVSAVPI